MQIIGTDRIAEFPVIVNRLSAAFGVFGRETLPIRAGISGARETFYSHSK
jgi:hypothetical protein